jgi:hypothetical protein
MPGVYDIAPARCVKGEVEYRRCLLYTNTFIKTDVAELHSGEEDLTNCLLDGKKQANYGKGQGH